MGTFVLVHGAAHGSWCWYKIVALLRAAGHVVIAPDLPGSGIDRTPFEQVQLQTYVSALAEILREQDEPVTLVGHSMAGPIISQVAEDMPRQVRVLVYLASFLLKSGESLMEAATQDMQSLIAQSSEMDVDRGVLRMRREMVSELFYHDCALEDIALAQSLLTPQAVAPLVTPIWLTDRYEGVRRAVIETVQDRLFGIDFQRQMHTKTPCDQIFSLNTSHSPFFSAPEKLVECLLAA